MGQYNNVFGCSAAPHTPTADETYERNFISHGHWALGRIVRWPVRDNPTPPPQITASNLINKNQATTALTTQIITQSTTTGPLLLTARLDHQSQPGRAPSRTTPKTSAKMNAEAGKKRAIKSITDIKDAPSTFSATLSFPGVRLGVCVRDRKKLRAKRTEEKKKNPGKKSLVLMVRDEWKEYLHPAAGATAAAAGEAAAREGRVHAPVQCPADMMGRTIHRVRARHQVDGLAAGEETHAVLLDRWRTGRRHGGYFVCLGAFVYRAELKNNTSGKIEFYDREKRQGLLLWRNEEYKGKKLEEKSKKNWKKPKKLKKNWKERQKNCSRVFRECVGKKSAKRNLSFWENEKI